MPRTARIAADEEFDDDFEPVSPRPSRRRKPSSTQLPGFVTAVAIIDLVISTIGLVKMVGQLLTILAALVILLRFDKGNYGTLLILIVTLIVNLLLNISGIIVAILMLVKSPRAIPFGWTAVGLTGLSMLLVLIDLVIRLAAPDASLAGLPKTEGSATELVLDMAIITFIRGSFLWVYITALRQFSEWVAKRR